MTSLLTAGWSIFLAAESSAANCTEPC